MVAVGRVEELFADARAMHGEALERLAVGDVRDAAEKAWCATKLATDGLILARTGRSRGLRRGLRMGWILWRGRIAALLRWWGVTGAGLSNCMEIAFMTGCATSIRSGGYGKRGFILMMRRGWCRATAGAGLPVTGEFYRP